MKELLAVVRSLARSRSVDAAKLYCGNITLDRDEMELSSPTGSYRLSKKEYPVMEMLMMAFGHGIRKNRTLEKLWQTEADAVSEITTVYTSYLSQKLKALQATIAIYMMGDKYCLQEVENEI